MKIFAMLICICGALILYCSHHHQSLLKQHLSKSFIGVGVLLLLLSLLLLLFIVPKLVALYMWLMTIMTIWSIVPFISLLKKNEHHEISGSTKNSN